MSRGNSGDIPPGCKGNEGSVSDYLPPGVSPECPAANANSEERKYKLEKLVETPNNDKNIIAR